MTTLTFQDAAILGYLSRNRTLSNDDRAKMTSGLSRNAAPIARTISRSERKASDSAAVGRKRTSRKSARTNP